MGDLLVVLNVETNEAVARGTVTHCGALVAAVVYIETRPFHTLDYFIECLFCLLNMSDILIKCTLSSLLNNKSSVKLDFENK